MGCTMKKALSIIISLFIILSSASCDNLVKDEKYNYQFFGVFDTIIQVVGYSKTEKAFSQKMTNLEARFQELSRLYDRFTEYEGINNICTINKNAGKSPVKVDKRIIDILLFSKEWYQKTDGKFNIAFGPVTLIWHNYLMLYGNDSSNAILPPDDILKQAAAHTDIDKVIVDAQAGTVFLTEEGMSLDLGAVAKGYATELAGKELYEAGLHSFAISSGGNVRVFDKPEDAGRKTWSVGIQNPNKNPRDTEDSSLDTVFLNDSSVVTSGDYERYYMMGNKRIHHITDPATLMPAEYYRSVTVVIKDSGLADIFSTTLYILPYEESLMMAQKYGVEAYWVFSDGSVKTTAGLIPMLKVMGGASQG